LSVDHSVVALIKSLDLMEAWINPTMLVPAEMHCCRRFSAGIYVLLAPFG